MLPSQIFILFFVADKSRDQNCSRTMVSQVSIALNPMGSGANEDLPDVFEESS